ncbi:cinnamoyl-CoA reductase 1-like [Hordeum vulgare subsp. vulgare]|uniref:NAD-dependent epimerase/dehydratase domain-containing protein n=1 Tax=Hordeum vulgare subsp. vulgare TaxID=112509 RepID=A0A8I6Z6X8_HORVV|nr:cinnamoyl-CoA reductase 1-like [Hordeum vulgare subsp. vulgare]
MDAAGTTTTACVTGAGGFVASWLVKLLLSRGGGGRRYAVRGTVRDLGDAKNAHLPALDGAAERLRLFKADLLDYGSMAAAIAGCDVVFHVACPVLANHTPNPEADLIAPAVTGTMNVLKACSEAKVKRVVMVSSVAAVMTNPSWPEGKPMDEDCWSDVDYCRTTENWYNLSKTLAELQAFDYAKRSGLDVVTVCPSLVIGPLLQPTVNASSSVIVDFLKGEHEVKSKIRNFVDVRDLADALILVYETPEVSGRYICSSHASKVSDVIDLLKSMYPAYKFANKIVHVDDEPSFSSRKLEMLGWKIKPLEETLRDSVESYKAAAVLN